MTGTRPGTSAITATNSSAGRSARFAAIVACIAFSSSAAFASYW